MVTTLISCPSIICYFIVVKYSMDKPMLINEITTTKSQKPLTPAQARIAALKHGVDSARNALNAERKRQKIQSAQNKLQNAVSSITKP